MAWTNYTPTSTDVITDFTPVSADVVTNYAPGSGATYTGVAAPATSDWFQLEPWLGFGISPGADDEYKIHQRGFGDPLTPWVGV